MLDVCCRKNVCCQEKIEGLSLLSFDEIKHLIHSDSGETGGSSGSNWRCSSDEQVNALTDAPPGGKPGADLMSANASQVGHVPSKVSSWRQRQLQASYYLREEAHLNDVCNDTYDAEERISAKDLQVFETHVFAGTSSESPPECISTVNKRALEIAAAATVYACGATRTSSTPSSTPRSSRRLHNGGNPSTSRDISRTEAPDLMDAEGRAPLRDISKDGWSVCSDDAPPGGCTRSSDTPVMGALVIEYGYKFDSGGFHEVGTLDALDDALDLGDTVDLDEMAQQTSLRLRHLTK